ncbi:Uncharacterized protein C3F10.06c [Vitis vinifera]|uniref:Uncharacterized protein C3F10.06c n=1 Tax=Vitis vinifera TaxID=29760 RepID=A0A438DS68_VITVI|nr:Uncharacterized protein C3F10.06c [Vitis vinifera]
MAEERLSIYRVSRSIKRKENSLYNALRSIYEDSIFVGEISQLWPQLPLLANLRCGLWYSPNFQYTCYFKSTDGHTNNCSFNTSRLNFHVALLAGQRGGCIIVDSTRRGKRIGESGSGFDADSSSYNRNGENTRHISHDWDCSLHLPLWVSKTEKAAIEDRLEEWTKELEASGADIASLALSLKKPLRPLWISQKTVIWLNEVPDCDSWDFTPMILVSASSSTGIFQNRTTSEFSWKYIPGAGDDEESWARGLSPKVFWNHASELINSGPDLCNQKVATIVENDRVYRAHRGQNTPQVTVKLSKLASTGRLSEQEPPLYFDISNMNSAHEDCIISWLGSTNLAVGIAQFGTNVPKVDCILNCHPELVSACLPNAIAYLHLPIVNSKLDRFSLLSNLPSAFNFAKSNLSKGKSLLVCCHNGKG